jgi:hypothetical protein
MSMKKLRDLFKRKTPQQVPLRPQHDVDADEQRKEVLDKDEANFKERQQEQPKPPYVDP